MPKRIYLFVYLIIIAYFFYLIPFGYLTLIGRGFPILIMALLWLWYGLTIYKKRPLRLYQRANSHFIPLFYLSILPSIYMAYYLFNQGFGQSIISYRNLLLFLAIPAFLKIELSEKDIIRACFYFSIVTFVVSLLHTVGLSSIFILAEKIKRLIDYKSNSSAEFLSLGLSGVDIILIPLYFYCQKLYHRFSFKVLFYIILLFGIVFLGQNRSTLFPAALVVGFTFVKSNMRPILLKYFIILVVSVVALYVLKDTFLNLIEETNTQVSSTYDPRVKAMNYFLDFDRMSWGEILFGTGNISFVTSPYVKNLQAAHIHYSDVGFVGFWSQYGILPVMLFLYYLIKGLRNKRLPGYVRVTAAHILICGATICYFDEPTHMMWFILFFYLMNYHLILNQINSKTPHFRTYKAEYQ